MAFQEEYMYKHDRTKNTHRHIYTQIHKQTHLHTNTHTHTHAYTRAHEINTKSRTAYNGILRRRWLL